MKYWATTMLICLLALAGFLRAADTIGPCQLEPSGAIKVGGMTFGLIHFNTTWESSAQRTGIKADAGYPKRGGSIWEVRGQFATKGGGSFALREVIRKLGEGSVVVEYNLQHREGIPTNTLALMVDLPVPQYAGTDISIDGKPFKLPANFGEMGVFSRANVAKLQLPTANGVLSIEGPVTVNIQDDRKFNSQNFAVRLSPSPSSGSIKEANLRLTLRYGTYDSSPIDISRQANMAWSDEVAGDQKGGWTDQGPDNDLRMIPLGKHAFGPLDFQVIDPSSNSGKACIVLAGPTRDYLPKSVAIPVADKLLGHLYVLHASAWKPVAGTDIGTINVTYTDGSQQSLEVQTGREVGDWWAPVPLSNGGVVWTAENKSAFVGLYLSRFDLQNKAVRSLQVQSSGKAVWMIAGISASPEMIPLPKEAPAYIIANDQWKPLKEALDVEPGSILDFSSLADAPAGKYGNVMVKGAHFEFTDRPGQPLRFYGANLCFSANFPDRTQAEVIATRLARIGYNCIRIHHYDWDLTDQGAANSTTLNLVQLDKLDYFVSRLKAHGLYINIDLYTYRQTRASEIPEVNRPVRDGYKVLVPLLDSAMNNWQAFASALMTHKNPYTGFTWATDPVLVGICPLNEDPLTMSLNASPDIRKLVDDRYQLWLKKKEITLDPKNTAGANALFTRFLTELQLGGNQRTFAYLKSLGVKAPLTSVNCMDSMGLTPVRAQEEYVDNHAYWDHPRFPEGEWSLPHGYNNKSVVAAGASVPRGMIPTRIIGKPFTTTEINYCMPNRYRAESGPVLGAYAGLQDWDGVYRFAFSHNLNNLMVPMAASGFDLACDPLNLFSERIALLLFLRRDVAPAKQVIPFVLDEATATSVPLTWVAGDFPESFQYLGLHTGIGSAYLERPGSAVPAGSAVIGLAGLKGDAYGIKQFFPANASLIGALTSAKIIPADAVDIATHRATSDTGQIRLAGDAGTFQVTTDRSECFVFSQTTPLQGKAVGVTGQGGFTVLSVSSMDGKPIAASGRLLVMHLTDLQASKTRYRNQAMTLLERWGQLPNLVRVGKTQVSIKFTEDKPTKVWAIDLSGRRGQAVQTQILNGSLSFLADTAGQDGACLAYEVLR